MKYLSILLITMFSFASIHSDVIDTAGFFSASAVESANNKLRETYKRTQKELVIETIESIGSQKIDTVAMEKAKSRKVNGVYVLISKKESRISVLVGNKTSNIFTSTNKDALREKFVSEFKSKSFDQGLNNGVDYFNSIIIPNAPVKSNTVTPPVINNNTTTTVVPPKQPVQQETKKSGFPWLSIILVILIGFIIFRVVMYFIGRSSGSNNMSGGMGSGYGQNNYGGGGGGMGFFGSMMAGVVGAVAGNWIYDKLTGNDSGLHAGTTNYDSGSSSSNSDSDTSYSGDSSSFDSGSDDSGGDFGGGDFGGGGDW